MYAITGIVLMEYTRQEDFERLLMKMKMKAHL